MRAKLAMISVGMNTPTKIEEERIWCRWLRSMCGDRLLLMNLISKASEHPLYRPDYRLDYYKFFDNIGHIPGVCMGFSHGIGFLRKVDYVGGVIFTNPDVIPNEEFKNTLTLIENNGVFNYTIFGHDWGKGCIATDFLYMPYPLWTSIEWPTIAGQQVLSNGSACPIMRDASGYEFLAPTYSNMLEQWLSIYLHKTNKNTYIINNSENVAWPPNVGVRMDIGGSRFNIIHSGGDARPTKKHLTNKYLEFDRDYVGE